MKVILPISEVIKLSVGLLAAMTIITKTNNGSTKLRPLRKTIVLLNPILVKEIIRKIKPHSPNTISTSLSKCQVFLYLGSVWLSSSIGLLKKECVIANAKRIEQM